MLPKVMNVAVTPASDVVGKRSRMLRMPLPFPLRRIVGNRELEERVASFVWFAIPLEYYVLTRFAGGLELSHFLGAVLIALLTLLAVLLIGCAAAFFPMENASSYAEKVRTWSVSLIITWASTLLLLALSYFAGSFMDGQDLIAAALCQTYRLRCVDYPAFNLAAWDTVLIYGCYALVATALIFAITWRFGKDPARATPRAPSVATLVILTALLMTVMHGATKWVPVASLPDPASAQEVPPAPLQNR